MGRAGLLRLLRRRSAELCISTLVAALAFLGLLLTFTGRAQAQAVGVHAYQETASLLVGQSVHARATARAPTIGQVAATRPLTGNQTVLPVIATAHAGKHEWLLVRLPQRPDGSVGWISAAGVRLGRTPWHIVVIRSQRQAVVYDRGRAVRTFWIIVGKPSTPTPAGRFFVAEKLYEGYGVLTGPWALATSAYSNVFQEFDGGPGQVALHGLVGLSGALGTAASHGCIRFGDGDITWLAQRLGAGTPITIL
jgi:lipoprotein-anchoring transpeptidase ErfK/SrfK